MYSIVPFLYSVSSLNFSVNFDLWFKRHLQITLSHIKCEIIASEEISVQTGNKNSSIKKIACNKGMGETNILIKLHRFILGNYFLELLQRTKLSETTKSMVFHHLYKTPTFARIKGREKDLEKKYWNKIQSILFTEKSNIILVWYKTKNEWCFSSPNN